MRNSPQLRLRGSDGRKPRNLFCMVCAGPMPVTTLRKTCSDACRRIFKALRRAANSVRCWVEPEDGSFRRFRRWLPKRFAIPLDTGVSTAFGARRAILPKSSRPKARKISHG